MLTSGSITVRGGSHIQSGKPCQDYSSHLDASDYSIIAVADGHGGSRYFRSDVGSRVAVEVSMDVISRKMSEFTSFRDDVGNNPETEIERMSAEILDEWRTRVSEYESSNPLNQDEIEQLAEYGDDPCIIRNYGTTLLVAVMSKYCSFGLQIGDGDFVVIYGDGRVESAMPDDPDCILNMTASLCQESALKHLRTFYTTEPIAYISVSTDGMSSSFQTEDSFLRNSMAILSQAGTDDFWQRLNSNLEKRSGSNRKDDVSLALILNNDVDYDVAYEWYGFYAGSRPDAPSGRLLKSNNQSNRTVAAMAYSFRKNSGGYYGRHRRI